MPSSKLRSTRSAGGRFAGIVSSSATASSKRRSSTSRAARRNRISLPAGAAPSGRGRLPVGAPGSSASAASGWRRESRGARTAASWRAPRHPVGHHASTLAAAAGPAGPTRTAPLSRPASPGSRAPPRRALIFVKKRESFSRRPSMNSARAPAGRPAKNSLGPASRGRSRPRAAPCGAGRSGPGRPCRILRARRPGAPW